MSVDRQPQSAPAAIDIADLGLPRDLQQVALRHGQSACTEAGDPSRTTRVDDLLPVNAAKARVDALVLDSVAALARNHARVSGLPDEEIQAALNVCLPTAQRWGMWTLKRRLEDAALQASTPARHAELSADFDAFRDRNTESVDWTRDRVAEKLKNAGIPATVVASFCNVAGAARRLQELGSALDRAQVTEFYDLTVIVEQEQDCYRALSAVHLAGVPVPGTVSDLIAAPRSNGFSGLLSQITLAVPDADGGALVVQVTIQTPWMSTVARLGITEPACYVLLNDAADSQQPRFVQALLSTVLSDPERPNAVRSMTVLAEGGSRRLVKPYSMPECATVLDLAYKVHSRLGDQASWGKVNGRAVSVGQVLRDNDRVEIMATDQANRDEGDLRHATTRHAQQGIRLQLNRDVLTRGRRLIRQYLETSRGIILEGDAELDGIAAEVASRRRRELPRASPEALYRMVGGGSAEFTPGAVGAEFAELLAQRRADGSLQPDTPDVQWVPGFPRGRSTGQERFKLCGRCSPRRTQTIVGLMTPRHVTVHLSSCRHVQDRPTIALRWQQIGRSVSGVLILFCEDRPRLVHDVCHRISRRGAGLGETHATTDVYARTQIEVRAHTRSAIALGELIEDLRSIPSVRTLEIASTNLPDDEQEMVVNGDWRNVRRRARREGAREGPTLLEPRRAVLRRHSDIVIPYNPQKPAYADGHFFGRAEAIAELDQLVTSKSPKFVFLTGPRRIGKTSLALHLADGLDPVNRVHTLRVDLRGETRSSSAAVLQMIATTLRQVRRPDGHHSDPRSEIAEIVRLADKPIYLILDEFGAVLESYVEGCLGDDLLGWLRTGMETPLGATESDRTFAADRLRVLMASPPEGRELLNNPGVNKQLGRLTIQHLWTIDPIHATEMAVRPFREAGVHVQRRAAEDITLLSACHPYVLIVFLHALAARVNARASRTEVSVEDVKITTDYLLRHEASFRDIVSEPGSDTAANACLRAVASAQHKSPELVERSAIVRATGLDSMVVDEALERLVAYRVFERLLSASSPPRYGFTVPLVRAWVQRNMYTRSGGMRIPRLVAQA